MDGDDTGTASSGELPGIQWLSNLVCHERALLTVGQTRAEVSSRLGRKYRINGLDGNAESDELEPRCWAGVATGGRSGQYQH